MGNEIMGTTWDVFSTRSRLDGGKDVQLTAGVNVYGDGPKRTIGTLVGFSDQDRLIATAAPDLLAALEKAALFVGWASTRGQILAGHDAGELCDVIDAAIAKATGSHHDQ
jgi:hypothetical protein